MIRKQFIFLLLITILLTCFSNVFSQPRGKGVVSINDTTTTTYPWQVTFSPDGGVTDDGDGSTTVALDTALNSTFLKLDCSNDPLTADLDIQGDLELSGTGPDITWAVTGGDTFGIHAESDLWYGKNNTDNIYYWLADSSHYLNLVPFGSDRRVGINKGYGAPIYNLDVTGDIGTDNLYVEGATTVLSTGTTDGTLATAGQFYINQTDDQICIHMGTTGEVTGEVAVSVLKHIAFSTDPSYWYDQESTYRVIPLFYVGDDFKEGFTLTEWRVNYVGGNPTTELDADLCYDTTPDFNPAVENTDFFIMDVLNTTDGSSSADAGFDIATAPNGSQMYIHFGADPVDANVIIAVDIWGYAEED